MISDFDFTLSRSSDHKVCNYCYYNGHINGRNDILCCYRLLSKLNYNVYELSFMDKKFIKLSL